MLLIYTKIISAISTSSYKKYKQLLAVDFMNLSSMGTLFNLIFYYLSACLNL